MSFQRTVLRLNPPAPRHLFRCALAIACMTGCFGLQPVWASQATATTLSVISSGNAVSSVAEGIVVALTATVEAGATALTLGQVNLCDATAASCTDIHLLGTAQLTSAGTAMLRFRPGLGNHSYKASFLGTLAGAPSSSSAVGLTVGPRPPGLQTTFTVTALNGPDATNEYALTASVGTKGAIPPSGMVSFLNTNNQNSPLGTATLKPVRGGTGFLNVPIAQPAGSGADALPLVATGDFNSDGIADIVSAPHGGIAISLGQGDGVFAAPLIPSVDSGDGINAFGVGDFNGDGITDLLVDDEDTGSLTVLLGQGDGAFTVGQTMPFNIVSIAIADFNGDGKLDLALPGNPQTTILLGNGDGTFTAAPNPLQISSSQLIAGDFNGDGKLDLAIASLSSNGITIVLGTGDATFTAAANPPQITTDQIVAADFNGDGKLDLAALDPMGDTVTILLGNGDGTFSAASTYPTGSNASSLIVGDFNGDNKPDLAVAGIATFPDHKATIFAGHGDGTFTAGFDINAANAQSLAAADFTGRGSSDLATFGSVLLGNLTISTATLDTGLFPGFNVIQADYSGDASNAASSSKNAPSILVPQQVFSLASNPIVVAPGDSASGSFSVTNSGFTGALNLSCSIKPPQSQTNPPVCSVPSSVNLISANATVDLIYTITTQAATATGQYTVTITAMYPLGGEPPASTSAGVSVAAENFLLSNSGATIASPGGNGTSSIIISPNGGFTGQVAMSCAVTGGPSGAINPPTCSIASPVSVTGPPITTTVTLNTQPATTPGSYTVTVTGIAGSLNAATNFAVNVPVPAAPPGFTLRSTAITIASPGAGGSSTITISPNGGFTGQVTMSCAVTGGPSGTVKPPTCAIASAISVTGSAVSTTLSLNTQPATTPGSYTVTVTGASASSLSAVTSLTVVVPAAAGFTLSSAAVTIASAVPNATSAITITPTGGFTGTVVLSCAVSGGPIGAADKPTCSITAAPAIIGGAPVIATLAVSTTIAPAERMAHAQGSPRGVAIGGSVVGIASLLWCGFPTGRRRIITKLGLLVTATLIATAIGCGGSAAAPPATPANSGTTPGAYIVTVTGTSGAITATTAVTVTVS